MFEKFTEPARQVVVLAQDEARQLGHAYIGTEHELLGLLRLDDGIAARVLQEQGLALAEVREAIVARVGRGEEAAQTGQIPFTPAAKETLEQALREALALGHNFIGTEHLLLGLVRVDDTATAVLRELGVAPEEVHAAAIRAFSSGGQQSPWEHAVDNLPGTVELPAIIEQLEREGWEIVTVQLIRRRLRPDG